MSFITDPKNPNRRIAVGSGSEITLRVKPKAEPKVKPKKQRKAKATEE